MLYKSAGNTVSLDNIQQENRDFHRSKSGKKSDNLDEENNYNRNEIHRKNNNNDINFF